MDFAVGLMGSFFNKSISKLDCEKRRNTVIYSAAYLEVCWEIQARHLQVPHKQNPGGRQDKKGGNNTHDISFQ
jgi:hypothetical protein